MNDFQSAIVAEAERWIGTPYRHQASRRGVGADCLGLVRGVWRSVYGDEPEPVPPYTRDWSEPGGQERLWEVARRHLDEKNSEVISPSEVLLFRMRESSVAKHLGILIRGDETPEFVHAYSGQGVVRSPLSRPWRRRVVSVFAFRPEAY